LDKPEEDFEGDRFHTGKKDRAGDYYAEAPDRLVAVCILAEDHSLLL